MTGAAKKLLEQALALPRASRVELVDALQQSLDADVELSDEWKSEIARRIERIERGEAELLDGDAVLRELRERYPER